jgi:transposase
MPRYNKPRRTWRYTNEFKVKAVQLSLLERVQVKDVANTLDIRKRSLNPVLRPDYTTFKLSASKFHGSSASISSIRWAAGSSLKTRCRYT